MDIDVSDYKRFQARMKSAPAAVKRAIRKRLREAGRPLGEHVRDQGSEAMPSRGGLAARLAGSPVSTALLASGVNIWVGNRRKSQFTLLNKGLLRHPVWGNPKVWRSQPVPEGTYSAAFADVPADVRRNVEHVLTDAIKELT